MATSGSVHQQLHVLVDEIQRIASSVIGVHGRLAAVSQQAADESAMHLHRLLESERQMAALTHELNSLRRDRQQLVHSEDHKAIRRKLRHARQFAKDLLDEREQINPSGTSPATSEKRENLRGGEDVTPPIALSSKNTSVRTSNIYAESSHAAVDSPPSAGGSSNQNGGAVEHAGNTQSTTDSPSNGVASSSRKGQGTQTYSTAAEEPGADSNVASWRLRHGWPPGSMKGLSGPITVDMMKEKLGWAEDEALLLEALAANPSESLQIEIIQNCVFLYDPMFLEARFGNPTSSKKTFLVDWGNRGLNERILAAIEEAQATYSHLHVFTFPSSRSSEVRPSCSSTVISLTPGKARGWWYVGAHTCAAVPGMWDVWQGLRDASAESRRKIVDRLCARQGPGHVQHLATPGATGPNALSDAQECARMLNEGGLAQLCVQMSGQGLLHVSKAFARDLRYPARLEAERCTEGREPVHSA